MTQIPNTFWLLLAQIESSNNPNAKAATSSASGLYQFVKSTWIKLGGKWGNDASKPFGGLYESPAEQLQRIKILTQSNADYLTRAGVPITNASLYASHFLGAYVASLLLKAAPTARADLLAGVAATNANPSVLKNKTVGQFKAWLKAKTGADA